MSLIEQAPNLKPYGPLGIFAAGNYGVKGSYTREDLQQIADDFNSGHLEVPLNLDHKREGIAYGWVKPGSAFVNDSEFVTENGVKEPRATLFATLLLTPKNIAHFFENAAMPMRSVELERKPDGGYLLKYVSLLGAQQPEVKDLPDKQELPENFSASAGDSPIVIPFSEGPRMADQPTDQITMLAKLFEVTGLKKFFETYNHGQKVNFQESSDEVPVPATAPAPASPAAPAPATEHAMTPEQIKAMQDENAALKAQMAEHKKMQEAAAAELESMKKEMGEYKRKMMEAEAAAEKQEEAAFAERVKALPDGIKAQLVSMRKTVRFSAEATADFNKLVETHITAFSQAGKVTGASIADTNAIQGGKSVTAEEIETAVKKFKEENPNGDVLQFVAKFTTGKNTGGA